jgi:hypothetical protein
MGVKDEITILADSDVIYTYNNSKSQLLTKKRVVTGVVHALDRQRDRSERGGPRRALEALRNDRRQRHRYAGDDCRQSGRGRADRRRQYSRAIVRFSAISSAIWGVVSSKA